MKTELEKMEDVKERSQEIGEFLEWLFETKKCRVAKYITEEGYEGEENAWVDKSLFGDAHPIKRHTIKKNELMPLSIDIEKLLAEYFEIDLAKVGEERREILKEIGGKKEK